MFPATTPVRNNPTRPLSYHAQAMRQRQSLTLTSPAPATPFGCCNFFDRCGDDLMSLHYAGTLALLDWLGFEVTDECYQVMEFIAWTRPAFSGGQATPGYLADPCADPNSVEYGTAKVTIEDFGRYGRSGPVREILKPMRYCATDPVRRLDNQLVTSEFEWDMRFATDALLQDIHRQVIVGNATTPGQMDGLERIVRNGYPGPNSGMIDANVINWNGNPMAGGAGITWNGAAVGATYNLIDVIKAVVRRKRQRISWARQLANQQLRLGNVIILAPDFLVQCLLDHFTCWSVCAGSEYNPVNLQQMESRNFRDNLLADSPQNLFGFGYIVIDNMAIPVLSYDWELIKGPTTGDIYILTNQVGGVKTFEAQHLDANVAAREYGGSGYFSIDGGRILGNTVLDNLCRKLNIWMHLRMFCRAPWLQTRIQNVTCDTPGGPLSPDPLETSFFPESSFSQAVC